MKKLSYIFLFPLLLGSFSCTDLEEEVFSQLSPTNFYNTVGDAEAAVISVYNALNRPVALWDFGMLSVTFMPAPHTQSRVGWRESWAAYTVGAGDNVSLPRVWNAWYQAIFRANVAIEELEARQFEDPADDQKRVELIAECKWLRGWAYFNLVRLFGAVPMPLVATTSIEGAQLPGTPIEGIYSQIIADLEAAEAALPVPARAGAEIGRPTVGTAKFLLGKVYLTMAGLPVNDASKMSLAHSKIKEVIDNASSYGYELLPSYEDAIRIDNNAERIWAVQQTQAVTNQGTALSFVWGGQSWPWGNGGQYHGGFTKAFYESYEDTDVRRDVTCAYSYINRFGDLVIYGDTTEDTNGDGTTNPFIYGGASAGVPTEVNGIAPNKYHDADQGCCDGDPDIVIYRYSDALLMYAEAENELNGPTDVAYDFLNQVRARGGASTYTIGSHTQDQFRDLIIQERYWELSFEFHEVYDLRRFGLVQDAIEQNFEAAIKGTTYRPDFELWPIPQSEIDANPNLDQNPGW